MVTRECLCPDQEVQGGAALGQEQTWEGGAAVWRAAAALASGSAGPQGPARLPHGATADSWEPRWWGWPALGTALPGWGQNDRSCVWTGAGQRTACRGQPNEPPQTAPSQPTGEVLTPRRHWVMHGAAQGVPSAQPQPPLHVTASRISRAPLFSEPDPGTHNLPIRPQLPEAGPAGTAGLPHTGLEAAAPQCQRLRDQGSLWRKCEVKRSEPRWNSSV